jgi:DNA-binding MarR family transcriptional regulator
LLLEPPSTRHESEAICPRGIVASVPPQTHVNAPSRQFHHPTARRGISNLQTCSDTACIADLLDRWALPPIAGSLEAQPAAAWLRALPAFRRFAAASDDTIGALANRTGLDQSTLSRNLRGLESEGLVEIAIVENDLRRRAVWLTETGARRLEKAIPVWRAASAKLSRLISTDLVFQLARETDDLVAQ